MKLRSIEFNDLIMFGACLVGALWIITSALMFASADAKPPHKKHGESADSDQAGNLVWLSCTITTTTQAGAYTHSDYWVADKSAMVLATYDPQNEVFQSYGKLLVGAKTYSTTSSDAPGNLLNISIDRETGGFNMTVIGSSGSLFASGQCDPTTRPPSTAKPKF